eukprot:SAG11_NODE_1389_length_5057_cov_16.280355_7_plen_161_part_00
MNTPPAAARMLPLANGSTPGQCPTPLVEQTSDAPSRGTAPGHHLPPGCTRMLPLAGKPAPGQHPNTNQGCTRMLPLAGKPAPGQHPNTTKPAPNAAPSRKASTGTTPQHNQGTTRPTLRPWVSTQDLQCWRDSPGHINWRLSANKPNQYLRKPVIRITYW